MLYRKLGELTKDYLGRVLNGAGLDHMAELARQGNYDAMFARGAFADGKGTTRLIQELDGEVRKTNILSRRDDIAFVLDLARAGAFEVTAVDVIAFEKSQGEEKAKTRPDWRLNVKKLEDLFANTKVTPEVLRNWIKDFPNDREFHAASQCISSDVDPFELRNALLAAIKERFNVSFH